MLNDTFCDSDLSCATVHCELTLIFYDWLIPYCESVGPMPYCNSKNKNNQIFYVDITVCCRWTTLQSYHGHSITPCRTMSWALNLCCYMGPVSLPYMVDPTKAVMNQSRPHAAQNQGFSWNFDCNLAYVRWQHFCSLN